MLTQAQIAEFRERGFLQAGRIMSDEQADRLRARLMEVMEGRGQAQPGRAAIGSPCSAMPTAMASQS